MLNNIKKQLEYYEECLKEYKDNRHKLVIKINKAKKLKDFNIDITEYEEELKEVENTINILKSIIRRTKNVINFYSKNEA